MIALTVPPVAKASNRVVLPGQYYTDGNRLYYIVDVHPDFTVTVENCETEFTHTIDVQTLFDGWTEVIQP